MSNLEIRSPEFGDGEVISKRFTCEGENINPPLTMSGIPEETQTLALVVTDPDIPEEVKEQMGIKVFDHWVAYNIDPNVTDISAGESVGVQGKNSSGERGYTGPCPPTQYEPTEHRYIFELYAVDAELDLEAGVDKQALLNAMEGHVIDSDQLVGRYEKQAAR